MYVPKRAYSRGIRSSVMDGNNARKGKKSLKKKDSGCETYICMKLLSFYLKTAYIHIRKDSFNHFDGTL